MALIAVGLSHRCPIELSNEKGRGRRRARGDELEKEEGNRSKEESYRKRRGKDRIYKLEKEEEKKKISYRKRRERRG